MKNYLTLIAAASLLSLAPLTASAQENDDWPQWRGPNRDDHSPDTGLLKEWPEGGPEKAWVFDKAGLGYAGFSIVDGTLYTMGARDGKPHLIALDISDGSEKWATPITDQVYNNNWGDGPRGTPTVDGDHVYTMSGGGQLICAKTSDGSKVWEVAMSDFGGEIQNWGYTESVLVDGDRVICTPGGKDGAILALNKQTGEPLWQSKEVVDEAQYSSPIVIENGGVRQVVQLLQKRLIGVDISNGKLLWETDYPGRTAVIPTPIHKDGQIYITAGYGAGCKSIKLSPENKVEVVYENNNMSNHHGGVVLVDGYIYGFADGKGWACQDFATGELVWNERDTIKKGAISYADGMLYCLDEGEGTLVLAPASKEGWTEKGRLTVEPKSEQRSPQGRIWTHPVIIGGKLYLRDQEYIYCYNVKNEA